MMWSLQLLYIIKKMWLVWWWSK